jgi:hypothetical protein
MTSTPSREYGSTSPGFEKWETKLLLARWATMGQKFGRLPHEMLLGIRDPLGVKIKPAAFLLDLKCVMAEIEVEEERRERETDG